MLLPPQQARRPPRRHRVRHPRLRHLLRRPVAALRYQHTHVHCVRRTSSRERRVTCIHTPAAEIHHEMLGGGGEEGEPWFYFCPRQEREARGGRPSRTTPSGYWKAAGTPGVVYSADRRPIGMKKTMVFYRGRAPSGTKTAWKMNEYRAFHYPDASSASASSAGAAAPPNHLPPQVINQYPSTRCFLCRCTY